MSMRRIPIVSEVIFFVLVNQYSLLKGLWFFTIFPSLFFIIIIIILHAEISSFSVLPIG